MVYLYIIFIYVYDSIGFSAGKSLFHAGFQVERAQVGNSL